MKHTHRQSKIELTRGTQRRWGAGNSQTGWGRAAAERGNAILGRSCYMLQHEQTLLAASLVRSKDEPPGCCLEEDSSKPQSLCP